MDNVPISERANRQAAEDIGMDTYASTPISSFGMNLMKSMGFDQQRGLGKNPKKAQPQILVLKPRPKGLGLGADPSGGNTQALQQYQSTYKPGMKVKIVKGPHRDLVGLILKSEVEQDTLLVQLEVSQQNVKVSKGDTIKYQEKEKNVEEEQDKQVKKKRLKWVLPGLTVKIIDKSSKYYLQKVKVLQITSERSFECIVESGKIIDNLTEKGIQTVIPKPNQLVIVVRGRHRGVKAKLKQREKGTGYVVVQTTEQLQMLRLSEDDVCAYQE